MARTATRRSKTAPAAPVLVGDERFLGIGTYARTRGVSRRTLTRWPGFPIYKVGRRCLVDPILGDEWILTHSSRRGPRSLESRRRAVASR